MLVRWLLATCLLIPSLLSSCAITNNDGALVEHIVSRDDRLAQLSEQEAARIREEEELAAQSVKVNDPADDDLFARINQDSSWWLLHGMQGRVQRELSLMADQAFIDKMFTEAPKYLHYIVDKVHERGMPIEIALLPGVESMFKPYAYSYAHAAGMWQIIPATGKKLGLEINWWHDERRDVQASTEAALDFLQSLAEKMDGDYLLALASYNAGIGRVRAAQERNRKKGLPTNFWALELTQQTQRYVPRLIALSMILRHPQRYDIKLPHLSNQPYFTEIQTREQVDLQHFANAIGMSMEKFSLLNPSYNQRFTSPVKQHRLLVPITRKNAAHSYVEAGNHLSKYWITHRITSGQTLSGIAAHFNTSIERLRSINKFTSSDYVKEGRYLLVPVDRESFDQFVAYHSSSPNKTSKLRSRKVVHRLRRGDSLWALSRKYEVSLKDLL